MSKEKEYYTLFNDGRVVLHTCPNWIKELVLKPQDFEWDNSVARTGVYVDLYSPY